MSLFKGILIDSSIIICIIVTFIVTGLWRKTELGKRMYRQTRKSPLSDNLLRGPGQTLVDHIEDDKLDFGFKFGISMAMPVVFILFYFSLPSSQQNSNTISLMLSVFLLLFTWLLLSMRKQFRQMQKRRLGYEGEVAVAQELNQLMRRGYYIFHDLTVDDKFNIDHVIIGPAGVFSVETKARSKQNRKGPEAAKVYVNGSFLQFPTYRDTSSLDQAISQAKWLSDFLSKSVGKNVAAQPMLTLPGWMVERQRIENGVVVINPKEADKLLASKPDVLDNQTIQQIKYQLDQRCRNIKPSIPI